MFESERQRFAQVQRGFLLGGIVLMLGLVATAGLSTGWLGTLVVLALIGAVAVIMVVIDRTRKAAMVLKGPASPHVSSYGQVVTPADPQQVWEAVHRALAEMGAKEYEAGGATSIRARTGVSLVSWGERISVDVRPSGQPGWGLVSVWSRPALPSQVIDYGRSQHRANQLLTSIPGGTPPYGQR